MREIRVFSFDRKSNSSFKSHSISSEERKHRHEEDKDRIGSSSYYPHRITASSCAAMIRNIMVSG